MRTLVVVAVIAVGACKDRSAERPAPAAAPIAATRPSGPAPARRPISPMKRTWTRPPGPTQPTAEAAWSAAETAGSAEAWDAAADAFERERERCAPDCLDTAYAAVLARKNALVATPLDAPPGDRPVPLPPRVAAAVAAMDEYVAMADPSDPDVPGMKFLAANALHRYRQPDALERLEALLRDNRADETAAYAANILLDALLNAGRIDDVKRLVDELLADTAFMAGKDQLRATLEKIRALTNAR
jgi:pentatricopeptide repeat protein